MGSLSAIILLAYIGLCAYVGFVVFDNPFDDRKFVQEVWGKFGKSDDPDNPRGQMVEDLQERFLKRGMMKQQVVNLLGEPDFEKTERFFKYNLGAWSGFRIDDDSLDMEFDRDGRLINSRTVQH
jgi:hypothetical protein